MIRLTPLFVHTLKADSLCMETVNINHDKCHNFPHENASKVVNIRLYVKPGTDTRPERSDPRDGYSPYRA